MGDEQETVEEPEVVEEPQEEVSEPEGAAEPEPSPPSSLAERFRSQGLQVDDVPDDQLLQQVTGAMRDLPHLRQMAELGQKYLQTQTQQPEPAKEQETDPWQEVFKRPEFDQRWLNYVQEDSQGNIISKPGYDPAIGQKVSQYITYRQNLQDSFWEDPKRYLSPVIQHEARKVAEEMVTSNLGQYREQAEAQSFIQQNADWLFQQDQGAQQYNAAGQPVLSQEGQRFLSLVEEANSLGIQGTKNLQQYAFRILDAERNAQQPQQAQPSPQQPSPAAPAATRKPTRRPSANAAPLAEKLAGEAAASKESRKGRSLQEIMTQKFHEAGLLTG